MLSSFRFSSLAISHFLISFYRSCSNSTGQEEALLFNKIIQDVATENMLLPLIKKKKKKLPQTYVSSTANDLNFQMLHPSRKQYIIIIYQYRTDTATQAA